MEQYIPKSALVAEIKKRKKEAESNCGGYKSYDEHHCNACTVGFYEEFLEILNAIKVKEVDLEKEIDDYMTKEWEGIEEDKHFYDMVKTELSDIARHFFELGLKVAQKGE